MRFAVVAAAFAALPTALGAINIVGPSPSSFWVQNTSNVITWTFAAGDPSPVDIVVVNPDNTTLNGQYFIANSVDLSNSSFTVTDVTLRTGSNYQVEFVSPQNGSQVLATSQSFQVMPPGTAPAPTSSVSPSSTSSSSGSSGSSTATNTSSGSTTSTGSPSPSQTNGASALGVSGVFGVLAACGAAVIATFL